MGVRCFACKTYKKANLALSYFSFPKDERLCALWFEAINQPRLPGHTLEFCHTSLRVCSNHFRPQDIVSNKIRKRLHPDAVPIKQNSFTGTKAGDAIKNEDIDEDVYEPNLENESGNVIYHEFKMEEKQVDKEECDKIRDVIEDQVLNDVPYKLDSLKEELDIGGIEIKEEIINEYINEADLVDQPDYVIICNHDKREIKLEDTENKPKRRKIF